MANDADDAIKSIEGFSELCFDDWDSYGAKPILPETITMAKNLVEGLRSLDCLFFNPAPGGDGSICFEICWADGRELWIDIQPPGDASKAYIPNRAIWNM